ncbi:uncharacterized protein LOC109600502 isoform X3 [Aethina tumida]|uniref:uncharacterized protein LOC109600502 isoform X3 n=1 Tax=Aethina tumida TaxID=116153 RepID=UPI00214759B6|nr:uncharacterized protein LOC109600502 isoform X3 [Aethina tumida]
MADTNEHKKELSSDSTVQRRSMNRGKPQQALYRPGSGPLRKSNIGTEDQELESNIIINSRHYSSKSYASNDELRERSEGSSLRDKVNEMDQCSSRFGDMSLNKDTPKKSKKPEQPLYVPKPVAQARESREMAAQESDRNTQNQSEAYDRFGNHRSKRYSNRRKENFDNQDEWRDKPGNINRQVRQGSEPRGISNGGPWPRQRDTRSVDPTLPPNPRNKNEKLQSKPPSGRRHSTIGMEMDKRHTKNNISNLPPRFQKKFLEEKQNSQTPPVEENWDGTSLTFQGGHPNQTNSGYHTLPNRGRGRARHQDSHLNHPGDMYRSITPDNTRSPCNSRPPTPPPNRRDNSRPQTPVNYHRNDDYRSYSDRNYNYDDRKRNTGISERLKPDWSRSSEERWDYDSKRDNRRDQDRRNHDRRNPDNRRDRREPGNRNFDKSRKPDRRTYNRRDDCKGDTIRNQDMRRDSRDDTYSYPNNRNYEENIRSSSKFNDNMDSLLSPVSPESSEEIKPILIPLGPITSTLDWSEEVELNDRLEQEGLSDALTRSSSMASLMEISTKSMPPSIPVSTISPPPDKKSKRRNGKRSKHRSGSRHRGGDRDRSGGRTFRQRNDSINSVDSRPGDMFKIPHEGSRAPRNRRSSKDHREHSHERFPRRGSKALSPETSRDRGGSSTGNWREEMRRNSEREMGPHEGTSAKDEARSTGSFEREEMRLDFRKAGVIVLPQKQDAPKPVILPSPVTEKPKYPENRKLQHQKSLFDHNNPSKPIIVKSQSTRVAVPGFSENSEVAPPQMVTTDQLGNVRPNWYDENRSEHKSCHYPEVIRDIKHADLELQMIINKGHVLIEWDAVERLRQFLKDALSFLLCKDLKFCETENVEQHLWKILYYNIIEVTRKAVADDPNNKEHYKGFLLYLIEEGNKYFEGLIELLQESNKFQLSNYLGVNQEQKKSLGYVGLALNSAQKIFIFLGDLGRYREQVNETANYGKCRQWYIKSHEINPKNGKPYNQLALLAVYSRRKLDAVYFYMRSLMSSNPVPSAKENLEVLFYEIRKKYEQGEKKRLEERLERVRQQMKQKESEETTTVSGSLRKETWIRPDGGKRVHRTTQELQGAKDSEEEDLASLSQIELNKRFVITYLHVLGKLITKTGMETFHEAALQMLKEFRALLQHTPVPMPSNRLLQLLALNMYAIESTQLKDPQLQNQAGYRSELQERALVVSLQMFNLILERCVFLIDEHMSTNASQIHLISQDVNTLLPAIKIWCDWMLSHMIVWNPPPSTQDFKVGTMGDCWDKLAKLMNQFEQIKDTNPELMLLTEEREGYELVKLPEDAVLCGFTPLTYKDTTPSYASKDLDIELAQFSLRVEKLLFFGTEFVCGLEPPVLKLEIEDGFREYVSVVCTNNSRDSPPSPPELDPRNDVLLESVSGEEEEEDLSEDISSDAGPEIRHLLSRKVELERKNRRQDAHLQRVKKILSQSVVSVHVEVRPKYLVPDTNCFVDHLTMISVIASSHSYSLMVPIVVLSELEGLSKGGKSPMPTTRKSPADPQHVLKVAEAARKALDFLKNRHQSVKCVTTKGAILASVAFTTEDDSTLDGGLTNDDKILATCLALCRNHREQPTGEGDGSQHVEGAESGATAPRQLSREVVLLTDDRNLRVKAHARDVPVRELPDFVHWAGLLGG